MAQGIAAIILAAGRGSRLGGVAKAGLYLADGRTYVQAIADTARAANVRELRVVCGAPHLEVTQKLALAAGCEVIVNPQPDLGMASSIVSGIDSLSLHTSVALIWPVDHPFVLVETVRAVVAVATHDQVVVPTCENRGGHPTAFGRDFWPQLRAAVARPRGARDVLFDNPQHIIAVPVHDVGIFRDVDNHKQPVLVRTE